VKRVTVALVLLGACGRSDIPNSDPKAVDVTKAPLVDNEHDFFRDDNGFGFLESFAVNPTAPIPAAGTGTLINTFPGEVRFKWVTGTSQGALPCLSPYGACWIIEGVRAKFGTGGVSVTCENLKLQPWAAIESSHVPDFWPAAWSDGGPQWTGLTLSGNGPQWWNDTINVNACQWSDTGAHFTPRIAYATSFDSVYDSTGRAPLMWVEIQFQAARPGNVVKWYRQVIPASFYALL
jgi:hypothetical protein